MAPGRVLFLSAPNADQFAACVFGDVLKTDRDRLGFFPGLGSRHRQQKSRKENKEAAHRWIPVRKKASRERERPENVSHTPVAHAPARRINGSWRRRGQDLLILGVVLILPQTGGHDFQVVVHLVASENLAEL